MFKYLDAYTLRARLAPAVIAAAPAFAFVALIISWTTLSLSNTIATVGLTILLFALSDFARAQGRKIEPALFRSLGGKPSVIMLRRSDPTFDTPTKHRYIAFLARMIGEPVPTAEQERRNAKEADCFYDRCGAWLREATRDAKKFSILFNENVTYGYRRNLFALKWAALLLNLAVVAVSLCMIWGVGPFTPDAAFNARLGAVFVVAAIHALYIGLAINRRSLEDAASAYARQLILSCESFLRKSVGKAARQAAQSPKKISINRMGLRISRTKSNFGT